MKIITLLLLFSFNSFAGSEAKIKKNMDLISEYMRKYSGYNTDKHETIHHLARQNSDDQCTLDLQLSYIRYSVDGTRVAVNPSKIYLKVDMRNVDRSGFSIVETVDYHHGADTYLIYVKAKNGMSFPVSMYKTRHGDRLNWAFYPEDYVSSTYFDDIYLITRYKHKNVVKALKKLTRLCRKL